MSAGRWFVQIVVLVLGGVWSFGAARAEETALEPYVAYVARPGEYTRCGPAESFYQADPLKPGEEVEVYVETKDGWLGIRPPESSFCWLQADHVRVEDDEITGTIVDSNAVAWIGTHLGKARQYRWQVQLAVGEEVSIIGTARRQGAEGNEVWYRIVPPPGEFRWLHESQVVGRVDLVKYTQPTSDRGSERLANNEPKAGGSRQPQGASSGANTSRLNNEDLPIGSGVRTVATQEDTLGTFAATAEESGASSMTPTPPGPSEREGALPSLRDWLLGGALDKPQQQSSVASAVSPGAPERSLEGRGEVGEVVGGSVRPASFLAQSPNGFRVASNLDSADVETIKLELSRAMAAGASADQVDELKKRCAWLSLNSESQVDRGRAALLLQRVDEYQQIARRRDGVPLSGGRAGEVLPEKDVIGKIAETGREAKFDRQGQLVRVYSSRPDAPPYAITDSVGRTICYVTPVPGVNLRRYLNQEVGLYGRLAFDTTLETPHLITEQAVRLRR